MNNYKIKVKDEAESKEAQELFFELGYIVVNHVDNEKGFIVVSKEADSPFNFDYWCSVDKELTLPQLRDLVVLKRNDINDANWETEGGDQIFNDSNNKSYIYRTDGWDELQRHEMRQAMWEKSKAIAKPQDPALISGADALRALIDGHEVQGRLENQVQWIDINPKSDGALVKSFLTEKNRIGIRCYFRFKPQTIKLELELPKPFEPKVGEEYFYLNSGRESGFAKKLHDGKKLDYMATQFGAWRTEEEIKQVVEQLRKIRGTNS
ncbi:hypothetical protein HN273_00315 [Acinetobacter baumannii]|uniref:hypothetical protein n=1 Tax=Acinetobacter baumannii TaxID=470 RepID=UPI001899BB5A|nr:hypothetical protein [Acinetobacter baumannii]MBF6780143.1 hypothetical protein [Acinetobacter baumannii]